jgi:hypothetical protein
MAYLYHYRFRDSELKRSMYGIQEGALMEILVLADDERHAVFQIYTESGKVVKPRVLGVCLSKRIFIRKFFFRKY